MKKLTALFTIFIPIAGIALAGPPSAADQKWLEVVKQKVAQGQTRISTPIQERVTLLQDWAGKSGYTITVAQSEHGFRLALAKNVAPK